MSAFRIMRYARQDGIGQWWKESLRFCDQAESNEQWRRIWWLICEVDKRHDCGCGDDLDWICDRCWVLAWARRSLNGWYRREGDDACGYSHGRPKHDPVPARAVVTASATSAERSPKSPSFPPIGDPE